MAIKGDTMNVTIELPESASIEDAHYLEGSIAAIIGTAKRDEKISDGEYRIEVLELSIDEIEEGIRIMTDEDKKKHIEEAEEDVEKSSTFYRYLRICLLHANEDINEYKNMIEELRSKQDIDPDMSSRLGVITDQLDAVEDNISYELEKIE